MSSDCPTQVIYADREALLVFRTTRLHVVAGPDQGKSVELPAARAVVGTASDNDLVLGDAGVSRHHLEIQIHDRGYLVRDLDSTNGTYYRGARIREALLRVSGEIRLGSTVLRFEPGKERSGSVSARDSFGRLVGSSTAMQQVYGVLSAVAPTDVTVLIEGETGTGKELAAEQLHRQSARASYPFSVIDCGALSESLIESELFGHEKGAFTGAAGERIGIFEKSRGGTVFLDEIGELPLHLQTRLLRVLDKRTIRRVGSNVQRKVDVRLVAATNRNLKEEVAAGRFRQDLLFRLSVVKIRLPPLRKRKDDIRALARNFLLHAGAIDPDAVLTDELLEVLRNRRWPGNVRELRNVVERAMVMADAVGFDAMAAARETEVSRVVDEDGGGGGGAAHGGAAHGATGRDEGGRAGASDEEQPAQHGWLARALPQSYLERPYKTMRELLLQQFDALYLGRLVDRHGTNISAIARDADIDRHVTRRLLRKLGLYE